MGIYNKAKWNGMKAKKFGCQKCSSYCEIIISRANKIPSKNMLSFPEDHVKAMLLWKTLCCELITVPGQPAITDTTIFAVPELFIERKRHCAINDLKTLREKIYKDHFLLFFKQKCVYMLEYIKSLLWWLYGTYNSEIYSNKSIVINKIIRVKHVFTLHALMIAGKLVQGQLSENSSGSSICAL